MRWTTKATIQNAISWLPDPVARASYFQLQRRFGGLRQVDPTKRFAAAIRTWDTIVDAGKDPRGGAFFEVGTGWMPNIPLAYWLMGARSSVTVDLNPYLSAALVEEVLAYLGQHTDAIVELFGDRLVADRLDNLLRLQQRDNFQLDELLKLASIRYLAPCDAAATGLPDAEIDFHTSYTVLEHIPQTLLGAILNEANRLLKPDGLLVHCVDYSDHFSHSDSSITAVNFLQFNDSQWKRLADNRFMYMNRLRHPDFLELFADLGHELVSVSKDVDAASLSALTSGDIEPDARFAGRTAEDLATTEGWFAVRPSS